MTRVALVARPAAGGIRRHISVLAQRLDRTEFPLHLFAPDGFELDRAVPATPISRVAIGARTSLLPDLTAIGFLFRQLKGRFDIVHCHGLRAALIGVPAARLAGIPALFTAHNLVPTTRGPARATLRFLARQSSVIAVSEAVRATLVAQGASPDRITVIPNGVDLSEFDSPPVLEPDRNDFLAALLERAGHADAARRMQADQQRSQSNYVVGAVGRLSPEKGFDVLLEAMQHQPLNDPPWALLLIAGDGPKKTRLKERTDNQSYARLIGPIADVPRFLAAVDVVAVPSRQEGQGIVALEAMAARRPVVATRVGGLVETVVENETGLLVPPDDPPALARALADLRDAPERRARMGAMGRRRVEELYSLDEMMHRITAVYRQRALRQGH